MIRDNLITTVTFTLTLNLGNYNSVKLGVTIEDFMKSLDEFDEVYDRLYKTAREKVVGSLQQFKGQQT